MKPSILLALVAAVASSVAHAEPREERGGRVPFTEPSRSRIPAPPPRVGDWVALATPTPTRFETEWIVVGRAAGAFRTVRIQTTAGIVHLRSVRIELPTGKVMMFAAEHWLDARHPNADIDLGAPRYIAHIAVTTARMPAGAYTVFGAAGLSPAEQMIAAR
jgi:hypothetical protein